MKEYSIIIPHKDIPDLLQRCLNSIPPRAEVEILVVDDNSNPGIVDFEHFPGTNRPDVQCFFTKEGKGAGYARNVGLQHAEGKWLLFADADDFFHEGMWTMLDKWKDTDNDIVFFDTDSVDSETLQPTQKRLGYMDYTNTNALRYRLACPIAKIIRKTLVETHQVRFDEVICAVDVMFSLETGYVARTVAVSSDVLYCATVRRGSLMQTLTLDHILCRLLINCHYNRFVTKHALIAYRFYQFEPLDAIWKRFGLRGWLKGMQIYIAHEPVRTMILDVKAWFRIRYYKYYRNSIAMML